MTLGAVYVFSIAGNRTTRMVVVHNLILSLGMIRQSIFPEYVFMMDKLVVRSLMVSTESQLLLENSRVLRRISLFIRCCN